MMKKYLLILAITIVSCTANAQKSIDALFEKYAEKDGFTTLCLNGSLLNFASCNDEEGNSLPAGITEIRILSQEDKTLQIENFYDLVIKDIDLNYYEEFMRVKESNQDLRMLVRMEGKRLKEFLLIAGGEDNALIHIKGNLSLEDAENFSINAREDKGLGVFSVNN